MLIFTKILVVKKKQKNSLRTKLTYFSYRQNSLVPSCAFLLSTTPVCWSLKGREVTFNSGLKERAKLKQQESVWEEVMMLQLEAQAKKR